MKPDNENMTEKDLHEMINLFHALGHLYKRMQLSEQTKTENKQAQD